MGGAREVAGGRVIRRAGNPAAGGRGALGIGRGRMGLGRAVGRAMGRAMGRAVGRVVVGVVVGGRW